MDNRTGVAILVTIISAGIYRIVVFRRLLTRLERASAGTPLRRTTWLVRGGDGVALDPTIVLPDYT